MKRLRFVSSSLILALSPNATVRVGAFNVRMFGEAKAKKANVLTALARIASTYDVLAVEEVGNNASTASDEPCASILDSYLRGVNELAGADAYCRGGFNADGGYFSEGSGTSLAGFDQPAFISAIGNCEDTTVASSSNTYDRIELSSSLSPDFSGNAGVFRFGESIDVSLCEGSEKCKGTESAVSDHYPVWAELYLNRDADWRRAVAWVSVSRPRSSPAVSSCISRYRPSSPYR
jgi:hypothetical protein